MMEEVLAYSLSTEEKKQLKMILHSNASDSFWEVSDYHH
jgi:hypothetical protein